VPLSWNLGTLTSWNPLLYLYFVLGGPQARLLWTASAYSDVLFWFSLVIWGTFWGDIYVYGKHIGLAHPDVSGPRSCYTVRPTERLTDVTFKGIVFNTVNIFFCRLSTPCILAVNRLFLCQLSEHYVKYRYLSPTSFYMFRCLLHHIQGNHCVTCSDTIRFLQCRCEMYKIPWFLNSYCCYIV